MPKTYIQAQTASQMRIYVSCNLGECFNLWLAEEGIKATSSSYVLLGAFLLFFGGAWNVCFKFFSSFELTKTAFCGE